MLKYISSNNSVNYSFLFYNFNVIAYFFLHGDLGMRNFKPSQIYTIPLRELKKSYVLFTFLSQLH